MTIVLSVLNEGEVFIVKELDPKTITYLERNIEGLMIKTDNSQGVVGLKYITLPKGYKIKIEDKLIKISFPEGKIKKGPINIIY
ncbi:MAG: hypothetical protein APG12_00407 [Candidatus Methanofastidiosum methylothiophilum]|uniref:Uncharacterized protein n=1 Tax=Candidatus Methanofastidiosum methylothiophilum TaxID=1705564 RepID=A0A150IMB1_9EURY|nr:MAG: hypothetical protein APG10_00288 [Candidatus Methanofastidiosum methylthiophilus]KYC48315.1 MAG: hypothetical protein APG11_00438 [Candidatus Methanofastidiosum methylthiophilus]KYC50984.1 MAG: hypothetical protein APG12_00407 [Candidatus Methanofastidiosum methylthiophilus]